MRITAVAPAAMRDDANSLAMCLAYGPSDGNTYNPLNWQDADGNLYAAASWEASPEWVTAAQSTLVRPEWDTEEIIDMEAAERAQAALVFWVPSEETPDAPQASTAALTAIGGIEGDAALALMGLTLASADDAE
jgi:hypothetical protein